MKRFFLIATIAFAAFNMNFVARYAIGAAHGDICQAHDGVCPHKHHDKALANEHSSHGDHHGRGNGKSLKCDCKKYYENSGLYAIPLPSQKTEITSFADLKEKSFESKTFHSNQSLSPPETPPRA